MKPQTRTILQRKPAIKSTKPERSKPPASDESLDVTVRVRMSPDRVAKLLNSLTVYSDVPIPPRSHAKYSIYNSFLSKLDLNQNVYITDEKLAASLYNAATTYGEKNGKSFARRKEIVEGKVRFGIWRIK